MTQVRRIHLRVAGRVQGVGFRRFVEVRALRRGLRGWVRNLADGAVEIVAEGPDDAVTAFTEEVRCGPPGALVRELTELPAAPEELAPEFEIRRDEWY